MKRIYISVAIIVGLLSGCIVVPAYGYRDHYYERHHYDRSFHGYRDGYYRGWHDDIHYDR